MLLYDSVDKVEKVFLEYGDPRWSLYSGKKSSVPAAGKAEVSNLLYKQEHDMDLHESWQMLRSKLQLLAPRGGYGHVFVGVGQQTINIPLYFPHPDEARINGVAPSQYPVGMAGIGLGQSIGEVIQKERELWDLQQQVRALQEDRSGGGFWDKLADNLLESEQLPALVSGLVSMVVGMATKSATPQIQQVQQAQGSQAPSGSGDGFRSRIAPYFNSRDEMEGALNRLADLIESNPEGVKKALLGLNE